jgi:transketolase
MIKEDTIRELERKSLELSIDMLDMIIKSKSSVHLGGGLSVMDILTVLYFYVLNVDPKNPKWENRDRLVLSKGHTCCALCPALAEKGYFGKDLLPTFNLLDSPFGMHPDMHKISGCDMSTGSLGQGLPVAIGMALAARYLKMNIRIYAVLGDGEMGEGSVWEGIQSASHFMLDNLCVTVDRNNFSVDGPTDGPGLFKYMEKGMEGTMSLGSIDKKVGAFGWNVINCNGHDLRELIEAYDAARNFKGKPTMIVAHTIKGKGVGFLENNYIWHYVGFNESKFKEALEELKNKLANFNK